MGRNLPRTGRQERSGRPSDAAGRISPSGRTSGCRSVSPMPADPSLTPYVPRLHLRHLVKTPHANHRRLEGTLIFADISGFTPLSERLARMGREGAERLVEAINTLFRGL